MLCVLWHVCLCDVCKECVFCCAVFGVCVFFCMVYVQCLCEMCGVYEVICEVLWYVFGLYVVYVHVWYMCCVCV